MANSLRILPFLALSGATLLAACDGGGGPVGPDKIYAAVQGLAYIDVNLDGKPTNLVDTPAPGVVTALVREGTSDTVARAVAGPTGVFRMLNVPIGRYTLVADRGAIIGDSLQIMPIDSAGIVLAANDTATREVRLSYATVAIGNLAQTTIGKRVSIEGVALNAYATFGDSTVHLVDASGFTRAVRVKPVTINPGDSIRVFGAVGLDQGGRSVLLDGTAGVLAPGRVVPQPFVLTTAAVASASNGARAYAPARITGAIVTDTARVGANWRVGVDDGSGRAELVLDSHVAFSNLANLVPGARIDASGLLVPTSGVSLGGDWQLKPRTPTELAISFNTVSIATARGLPVGAKVVVEGRALTSSTVFGDTVHILDRTGAVRGVRVAGTVAEGDSLRLLGTMGSRNGQPLIVSATLSKLASGVLPVPDSVSTLVAASADGGRLDAGQVYIAATIIGTSTQPNGDLLVFVDDGSGRLDVLFSKSAGLTTTSIQPGKKLSAAGVLVPSGTAGKWRLLPRKNADFAADFASATIAQARAMPQGRTVYVYGVALNESAAFTVPVLHLADATGAIRAMQIPANAGIIAGDSVQVLGTIAVNFGQPVLNVVSAEVRLSPGPQPQPVTLSTAATAGADGGTRDAQLVKTRGTVSNFGVDQVTGDGILLISDGSGDLFVRLDLKVGLTGPYAIGDVLDVTGVLSPIGDGTWLLKPRRLTDVTKVPAGG